MTHHPGLGPEHSGHDHFWSDENLNLRAQAASYADIAPINAGEGINQSAMLLQMQQQGVPISPLALAEVEVDQGGKRDELPVTSTPALQQPSAPTFSYPAPQTPAPAFSGAALDALALALMERMRTLGGQ